VLGGGFISDKGRDDALERGEDFHSTDSLGYFCRSFLLFRGALMNNEWIDGWRKKVGKEYINIPGCTSTSKNLEVALGFSKCHTKYEITKQPVLFIYSIRNYVGFAGFRLTDK